MRTWSIKIKDDDSGAITTVIVTCFHLVIHSGNRMVFADTSMIEFVGEIIEKRLIEYD